VLTHKENKGKGAALKTGYAYCVEIGESEGVVIADADGQHLPKDIKRVSELLKKNIGQKKMVVGTRQFDKNVPFRSQFGNTATRLVFAMSTGKWLFDTQTGLLGMPACILKDLVKIKGDRYEYEMNMLMTCAQNGIDFLPVTITTVYENNNEGSHFNPVKDAIRIYSSIAKFKKASIASFAAEWLAFLLMLPIINTGLPNIEATRVMCISCLLFVCVQTAFGHKITKGDAGLLVIRFIFMTLMLAIFLGLINSVVLRLLAAVVFWLLYIAFVWLKDKKEREFR